MDFKEFISGFLNWGALWRLSSVISGAIMLFYAPIILNPIDLSNFYALYASFAAVAIFDFGLGSRMFVTGFTSNNKISYENILGFFIRSVLIISFFILYGFRLLKADAGILDKILLLLYYPTAGFLVFSSLLYQSFYEGNVNHKYAYLSRVIGEVVAAFSMLLCLNFTRSYYSVFAFVSLRALIPLIILLVIRKPKTVAVDVGVRVEKNFSLKLGIITLLGYFSGTGLILVVHEFFDPGLSGAFSQAYLVSTTFFSFCISFVIYRQKELKEYNWTGTSTEDALIFKRKLFSIVSKGFVLGSFLIILSVFGISFTDSDFLKFDLVQISLILLQFYFLINNHIVAILFRVKGNEILFPLSVTGGVLSIVIALIFGYFQSFIPFLFTLATLSFLMNKVLTDHLFKRKLFHLNSPQY